MIKKLISFVTLLLLAMPAIAQERPANGFGSYGGTNFKVDGLNKPTTGAVGGVAGGFSGFGSGYSGAGSSAGSYRGLTGNGYSLKKYRNNISGYDFDLPPAVGPYAGMRHLQLKAKKLFCPNQFFSSPLGEQQCDPVISEMAQRLAGDGFKLTYALTGAQCYNKSNGFDTTPDMANVCNCIRERVGLDKEAVPEGQHSSSVPSGGGAVGGGIGDMMQATDIDATAAATRDLQVTLKDMDRELERCAATRNANDRDKCLERLHHFRQKVEERSQMSGGSTDTSGNTPHETGLGVNSATAVVSGSISKVMKNRQGDIAQFNSCLKYEDYKNLREIPTDAAFDFINISNLKLDPKSPDYIDTSDKKVQALQRRVILQLLEGKDISQLSFGDATDPVIEQTVKKVLESKRHRKSLAEFQAFARQNTYWKVMLKDVTERKVQDEVLDNFFEIYKEENPAQMKKKLDAFLLSKADVIEKDKQNKIAAKAAQDKIAKEKPWIFYSDYEFVNRKLEAEDQRATPRRCGMIADVMEGKNLSATIGPYPFAKSLTSEDLSDCNRTYTEICRELASGGDNREMATDDERQVINEVLDTYRAETSSEKSRIEAYLADADRICRQPHKMKRDFGNKEMSRDQFKEAICNFGNNYKTVSMDLRKEACGKGKEAEYRLSNLYANSFAEESKDVDEKGEKRNLSQIGRYAASKNSDQKIVEEERAAEELISQLTGTSGSRNSKDDDDDIFSALSKYASRVNGGGSAVASGTSSKSPTTPTGPTFTEELLSGMASAVTNPTLPAVDNNVQSYLNGNLSSNNIVPAQIANNPSEGQLAAAKTSIDNGVSQLEKRLASVEKQESDKKSASQNAELDLLRKQIEELKAQSESLKAQLDKEKDNKAVAAKSGAVDGDATVASGRSPASTNYQTNLPQVSGATQSAAMNPSLQPSKVFDNMYSDSSFHSVPTISGSKGIDSKAFNSRSSNDALLSIYTDKGVSSLVDAVATGSNNNILVVGNALEMQEATVKNTKFQTKELVIDQKRLDQVRSNPDILRSLIEENKIKNHVGILTLKNGDNQLNYIMRKDDSGKVVILPLNIARRVTLDNLKNELNQ